jgi:hypothetical protein
MERNLCFRSWERIQVSKLWRQFHFVMKAMRFINITVHFIKFAFYNEIFSLILKLNLIFVNLRPK